MTKPAYDKFVQDMESSLKMVHEAANRDEIPAEDVILEVYKVVSGMQLTCLQYKAHLIKLYLDNPNASNLIEIEIA